MNKRDETRCEDIWFILASKDRQIKLRYNVSAQKWALSSHAPKITSLIQGCDLTKGPGSPFGLEDKAP